MWDEKLKSGTKPLAIKALEGVRACEYIPSYIDVRLSIAIRAILVTNSECRRVDDKNNLNYARISATETE